MRTILILFHAFLCCEAAMNCVRFEHKQSSCFEWRIPSTVYSVFSVDVLPKAICGNVGTQHDTLIYIHKGTTAQVIYELWNCARPPLPQFAEV